ncbi:MAG: hypothetical protein K2J60_07915 [Acetatifactor sp.]|nr:hypothetical protein [Acetatifactor sp.]
MSRRTLWRKLQAH